jgi:hypothetical protein
MTTASALRIFGSSAASILSVCAPLILGYLGRMMRSENLSTAALAERLRAQRNQLASAVPLGFEMPEFFHAPYRAARTTVDETARRATVHANRERETTSWDAAGAARSLGLGGLIWWAGQSRLRSTLESMRRNRWTGRSARPASQHLRRERRPSTRPERPA